MTLAKRGVGWMLLALLVLFSPLVIACCWIAHSFQKLEAWAEDDDNRD
jgi:hypothetical protein